MSIILDSFGEWRNHFAKISTNIENGQLENVNWLSEKLINYSLNRFGDGSLLLGIAWNVRAAIGAILNEGEIVENSLKQAKFISDLILDSDEQDVLNCLSNFTEGFIEAVWQNFNESAELFQKVKKHSNSNFGKTFKHLKNFSTQTMASIYVCIEEFKKSEDFLPKDDSLNSISLRKFIHFLDNINELNGDFFNELLKEFDQNNFEVDNELSLLGVACLNADGYLKSKDDLEGAISSYSTAIEILTEKFGENNPIVIDSLFFLTHFLLKHEKIYEAKDVASVLTSTIDPESNPLEIIVALEKLIEINHIIDGKIEIGEEHIKIQEIYEKLTGHEYTNPKNEKYYDKLSIASEIVVSFEEELNMFRSIGERKIHPQIIDFVRVQFGTFNSIDIWEPIREYVFSYFSEC